MKKYICIVLIVIASSCKNTWDKEDKDLFYQSCLDDATTWAGSPENAKTYCDCMIEKIQTKYPHVSDALENIDKVINDPDMHSCKTAIAIDSSTISQ